MVARPPAKIFAYYYGQIDFGDQTSLATGSAPTDLRVADLDGDKLLDIVTANSNDSSLSLFVGQAGGLYGSATRIALPSNPEGLTAADIDGDSKLDLLITASSTNRLYTLRNTGMSGAGLFSRRHHHHRHKPRCRHHRRPQRRRQARRNHRQSQRQQPERADEQRQRHLGQPHHRKHRHPARGPGRGDVNKDGRPDVVVSSYQDGTVQLFLNNGSGG